MADTIPDISVDNTQYVSANALTSIVAGTAITIENKSNSLVRIQIATSQPSASSTDGSILQVPPYINSIRDIASGENTVWLQTIGSQPSTISVQEV